MATTTSGEYFAAPDVEALSTVYEELGSRLGTREEDREITDVFAALCRRAAARRGTISALPVPEGPVKRSVSSPSS